MREIKFRYRLKQLSKKGYEELFEYFTIQDLEKGAGITTAEIIARDQFIGLHDKNGKEIYEGDITKVVGQNLRSISCYQEFQPKIGDVFFVVRLKSGFNLCPIKSYGKLSKIDNELICNIHTYINNYNLWNGAKLVEIIGNKHENPELLKGD